MFRVLYDESQPLGDRVNRFREEADQIREKYWPNKTHYQDFNAVSTYLWARYPDTDIAIRWPDVGEIILSEKDKVHPTLAQSQIRF